MIRLRLALVACALVAAAQAQDQPAALDEVLVTAQRREQPLGETPVSVTLLQGPDLQRRRIARLSDLQFSIPNLTVVPTMTSRGASGLSMRGLFERDSSPTVDPAVGLYVDGVYIARSTGANLALLDVERVEVLHGPQGTLFGRNSIGGAVQIITRAPAAEFQSTVTLGAGDHGRREAAAVLNLPAADSALRLAAAHWSHDGFARRAESGEAIDEESLDFARLQFRLAPSDSWQASFSADATRSRTGSQWVTLIEVFTPATPLPEIQLRPADALRAQVGPYARELPVNRSGAGESRVWGVAATVEARVAIGHVKSITAYRELTIEAFDSDQDGTDFDISAILERRDLQNQWSQELQWYGDAVSGRLDWITGVHYFEEHGLFTQRFPMLVPPRFDPVEAVPWGTVTNDSLAAYAQASWQWTPAWKLTTGMRYNEDRRRLTSRNTLRRDGRQLCRLDPRLLQDPERCEVRLPRRRFSYSPFSVSLEYTPRDGLQMYGRLSRGHRAGGYNLRAATAIEFDAFDPEQVTSSEIGLRSRWLGGRLHTDFALFRSRLEDVQLTQSVPSEDPAIPNPFSAIRNGGEARVDGLELRSEAKLGPLRISGTLGWMDARYTRVDPAAVDVTRDSSFIMTPASTASVALDLPLRFELGEIGLHADAAWRGETRFWYDPDTLARQEAYWLMNASIVVRFDPGRLELTLWGRNLSDTQYLLRAFESQLIATGIPGEPRGLGLALSYRF